jgi:hypothetical protein
MVLKRQGSHIFSRQSAHNIYEQISTNITFLDINHRPVYVSKQSVLETGFCLALSIGPIE